ncbi:MAG: methyltransferase domain-containing protein [Hydrogenophaga sp.]|jgi:SAM-dependent methyltransferase|nr:methyltransferase domain-containing protein [Hydrogenophaga sp.]
MKDPKNLLSTLARLPEVNLDLGCGPFKKAGPWIGIDALDAPGVDIVGDVYEVLEAFPAGSVDRIHSSHFFEHVSDLPRLLLLIRRVLKPGGRLDTIVPHFSNAYFYSDPTHRMAFGLYSFSYMVEDDLLSRKVPGYARLQGLELVEVRLNFKSALIVNMPIRWIWQQVFNLGTFMKEWYEDSWSSSIPCYEVHFVVRKRPLGPGE